jgi:hypothetical protein
MEDFGYGVFFLFRWRRDRGRSVEDREDSKAKTFLLGSTAVIA